MLRSTFIKNLIALGGLSYLPTKYVKNYQKYYLLQCFVRGFRFYEGTKLINEMKEGDLLELVREQDNEHDDCAIALHFNRKKIGYIPAESNELLSKLLDIGVPELIAEITFLKNEAAEWEKVNVAVYVLKEITETKAAISSAAYLTQLETPHYRTLKRNNDIVTKVTYKEDDDEDWDDSSSNYYDYLVDNSKDNSIYTYIHSNLDPTARYEEQLDYLIVNKNKIADKPGLLERLKQIESSLYKTDEMFDDNGYIVLSVKKAEGLIKEISGLSDVADRLGRKFIELEF
jgi:hypothetical protein